mgnify:CR=1 FL=1
MKVNKCMGMAMMAAGVLAAASCTDFSDYNKEVADVTPSGNQTLWQNIQQNPQLSDFAALVEKAGFAENLNTTHYYTVWAPLNGTYDRSQYDALSSSALLRQFVKNHIADYGFHATGQLADDNRIMMLNEKSYAFSGSSNYTFDGIKISQPNQPSSNGLMHIMDGAAVFYPNLYEFVTDSTLAEGKNIDNLRRFFQKYENTYLDEQASVVGPIVDGRQTYVDSVMVTENSLWSTLRARIHNEDSSYTFIMPTNDCWTKTYDKIKASFNYINTTKAQVFTTTGTSTTSTDMTRTVTATEWKDSLASLYLTSNLIYSNNNEYNSWIEGEPSAIYGSDTLFSTTRTKLSNGQEIMALTKERVRLSNGFARLADSLAILPWDTYSPQYTFPAYSTAYQARVYQANATRVNVQYPDPAMVDMTESRSGTLSYLWLEATGSTRKPELTVYLPDVLSTTYNIYCVFVPEKVDLTKPNVVTLPNRVMFELNYCDADGNLQTQTFLDESEENINAFKEKYPKVTEGTAANRNTIRGFSNDTSKVDTLLIGEFTFPVCYYGLSTTQFICPNIKVSSPMSVTNKDLMADFSRDLRIAGFILKPKELVEYEETKMKN